MNLIPTARRCPETRAHYAHEWYTPLRTHCPGGPAEDDAPATPATPTPTTDEGRAHE